jgi:uncharacterized membrane protein
MEIVLMEWVSLGIRWLHVIAAVAWIGSSFYFMHLDASLRRAEALPRGTQGEAWQVHGGGFYHMVKFLVAPAQLPEDLTWFKWEAYSTWLSGFALLIVTYYFSADLLLVDHSVMELSAQQAVALSIAGLLAAWLVYEVLCRSAPAGNEALLAVIGFIFLVACCYGFTLVFSGRGAFIQMGALIGTIMVANVFVTIIPNQKKIVAALLTGGDCDPRLGYEGKQRSVHNNYLTLPVVFLMISNHYPLVSSTRYNWLIFAIILLIGFLIRHFYNLRHAGRPSPWWTWAAAALCMAIIAMLSWAGTRTASGSAAAAPGASFAEASRIVLTRCSMCHAAHPVWAGIASAPKGVRLDTPDEIRRHARDIEINAVLSHAMPPGNITRISDEDRQRIGAGLAGTQ